MQAKLYETTPPPVLISGLRISGIPRQLSALGETSVEGLILAPDERQIQVDFFALGFAAGEGLRYFLPAYLIADLMGYGGDRPVFHLTHGLVAEDFSQLFSQLKDFDLSALGVASDDQLHPMEEGEEGDQYDAPQNLDRILRW